MDAHRKAILIVGPILLIGTSLLLTLCGSPRANSAMSPPRTIDVDVVAPLMNDANSRLRQACETTAQDLAVHLDAHTSVLIRPPYVIAGDMSEELLDQLYRDVVRPTERALTVSFFDTRPTEPITIVAFSAEAAFRDFAQRVDRRRPDSYYGYYLRSPRRIVVNVSTGAGTLAHELTHALAHFDFPNMPEWFDEGLASLFEQSEFSESGLRLTGADNWRVHHVLRALHENRLRSFQNLTEQGLRTDFQAIDYAQARYLCLYLQDLQLLEPFYRKLRSRSELDPTGWLTMLELLGQETPSEVDADFRRWVVRYHKSQRQRTVERPRTTLSMQPSLDSL